MSSFWNSYLTESGNTVLVLCGITIVVFHMHKYLKNYISKENQWLLLFLVGVVTVFTIRIGYWIPALKFREPGETYAAVFIEWKWLLTTVCAMACLGFTYGLFRSYGVVDKRLGLFCCFIILIISYILPVF